MEDSEPESPAKAKRVSAAIKKPKATTQGDPEKKRAPAIDDEEDLDISGDEQPEPPSDDEGLGDDDNFEDPEDFESEHAKWAPKAFQSKSREDLAADFQAWLAQEEGKRKEM
ncbi:hypothetical protein BOTBODRAFT_30067 [Botryobasidium botryosum FD-172 SS1]|uniref:Uncharacterized protein n=1 Tax=Botryobasidium botryosum (strain FD-172 SS1) TaxID=930990 RepID=A0A067MNX0_BOTB1|nr:hypothetical protein BOTBODRAFT_30067 [Botryobasidium botryosum FD-172 SS1]